jgi:hypothetical protein
LALHARWTQTLKATTISISSRRRGPASLTRAARVTIRRLTLAACCPLVTKAGSPRRRRGCAGRGRRAQDAHQERPTIMMEESEAEKRTGAGIACAP